MIRYTLKNNILVLILLSIGMFALPGRGQAQIQINGTIDMEVNSGGEDSRFITNEIPNEFRYPHVSIAQLNALLFAPIGEEFFFEGRVQMDTWGDGRLNPPRIALANITWDDPDNNYAISLGRFINPFGFYSKRQLSVDRVFVSHPLTYDYFLNISDKRGYWPGAGTQGAYTDQDVGLSTIYFAGYATGISFSWDITPNKVHLDAALTNTAPASTENYTNLANMAGIVRLQITPSIYWQQGLSISHGSFMQLDPVNQYFRRKNPLEQYRQTLIGTDAKVAFGYWQIVGEAVFSHWNVPGYYYDSFSTDQYDDLLKYNLSNVSGNLDVKFEPPFLTGSHIAVRAEHLYFMDAEDPENGSGFKWDDDVTRLSGVFGYKFTPDISAKLSFSEQTPFDGSQYALRFQVSAFF